MAQSKLPRCGICHCLFPNEDMLVDHYPCLAPNFDDDGGGKKKALPRSTVRYIPDPSDELSSLESGDIPDNHPAAGEVAQVLQPFSAVQLPDYTFEDLQHRTFSVALQQEFGFVSTIVTNFGDLAAMPRRTFFTWDCPVPRCFFLSNSHTARRIEGVSTHQRKLAHGFILLRNFTIYPPEKQNEEVVGRLNRTLDALKESITDYLKGVIATQLVVCIRQDDRIAHPRSRIPFKNATLLRDFLRSPDCSDQFISDLKTVLDNDLICPHLSYRRQMADMLMKKYGFCKHARNDSGVYTTKQGASFQAIINDSLTSFRSSFLRILRDKRKKWSMEYQQLDVANHDTADFVGPGVPGVSGYSASRLKDDELPIYTSHPGTMQPPPNPWDPPLTWDRSSRPPPTATLRGYAAGGQPLYNRHERASAALSVSTSVAESTAEKEVQYASPADQVDALLRRHGMNKAQMIAFLSNKPLPMDRADETLEIPSRLKTHQIVGDANQLSTEFHKETNDLPLTTQQVTNTGTAHPETNDLPPTAQQVTNTGTAHQETNDQTATAQVVTTTEKPNGAAVGEAVRETFSPPPEESDGQGDTLSESSDVVRPEILLEKQKKKAPSALLAGPGSQIVLSVATGLPRDKNVTVHTALLPKRPSKRKQNDQSQPAAVAGGKTKRQTKTKQGKKTSPRSVADEVPHGSELAKESEESSAPPTQLNSATEDRPALLGTHYRCPKHGIALEKYQKILLRDLTYYSTGRILCQAVCQGNFRIRDDNNQVVYNAHTAGRPGSKPEPVREVCLVTASNVKKFANGNGNDAVCFHFCNQCHHDYDEMEDSEKANVAVLCSRCYDDYEEETKPDNRRRSAGKPSKFREAA